MFNCINNVFLYYHINKSLPDYYNVVLYHCRVTTISTYYCINLLLNWTHSSVSISVGDYVQHLMSASVCVRNIECLKGCIVMHCPEYHSTFTTPILCRQCVTISHAKQSARISCPQGLSRTILGDDATSLAAGKDLRCLWCDLTVARNGVCDRH